MWRKLALAIVLAILVMGISGNVVLADTPLPNSPTTFAMSGQAAVIGSGSQRQLRLKTQANDNSGWLLEVALNPQNVGSNGGYQVLNMNGTFTLGIPQLLSLNGTATGWIDGNNSGDIKLVNSSSSFSMDFSYSIAQDGSVTAQVQGTLPALPTPQPASSQPAQPVNHFFWYLSRTAGFGSYLLLFINICFGLGLKSRYLDKMWGRLRILDLHEFIGLLAIALLCLHVFSLLGDTYLHFTLTQLLVPVDSPYRQTWTALGIVTFYAALVVTFSFYFRKFIGLRAWRVLHISTFILFFAILFHSVKSGTDSSTLWSQALYVSTGITVLVLFLWRFKNVALGKASSRA